MREAIRRHVHGRPRFIGECGWTIGRWNLAVSHIRGLHASFPATFEWHGEGFIPMQSRDLPDALLLAILGVVRADLPAGIFLVLTQQHQRAPPRMGSPA